MEGACPRCRWGWQRRGGVLGAMQVLAYSSLQWSPLEKAGGNVSQCREEL